VVYSGRLSLTNLNVHYYVLLSISVWVSRFVLEAKPDAFRRVIQIFTFNNNSYFAGTIIRVFFTIQKIKDAFFSIRSACTCVSVRLSERAYGCLAEDQSPWALAWTAAYRLYASSVCDTNGVGYEE